MTVAGTLKHLRVKAREEAERMGAAAEAEENPAQAAQILTVAGALHRLADAVEREEKGLYEDLNSVWVLLWDSRRARDDFTDRMNEQLDRSEAEDLDAHARRQAAVAAAAYYVKTKEAQIEAQQLRDLGLELSLRGMGENDERD